MSSRAACAAFIVAALAIASRAEAQGESSAALPDAPSPFGAPDSASDFETLGEFRLGSAVFRQVWTPAGEGAAHFDGLGPLYNARSCETCHVRDGRGHPPQMGEGPRSELSMILKLGRRNADPSEPMPSDPVYGAQLQDRAIEGHAPEGQVAVGYTRQTFTFSDGERVHLRRPVFSINAPAYNRPSPDLITSARIAPPMIGLGLIQRIADADIRAHADPDDLDGNGISGRVSTVAAYAGKPELGRFGWKASQPRLVDQIALALSRDMGLSTTHLPQGYGDCTRHQPACRAAPSGDSPKFEGLEVPSAILRWLVRYAENLAVPPPRAAADSQTRKGEVIFANIGCANCHLPRFRTRPDADQPHLGQRTISPYSDFLLHDMGAGLDDGFREAHAASGEWRTAPLWGIGLTGEVNGNMAFLHDGRARSLTEAILWHGGEALAARNAFAGLDPADRRRLIAFLESL